MRYVSTRGGGQPQTFTQILLEGLAPDGGLFVPEVYPRFAPAELAAMRRWTCHCERSEAISFASATGDCRVASLLAMTRRVGSRPFASLLAMTRPAQLIAL